MTFQLEDFIRENYSNLDLPPSQDTVFEYLVNENGEWEHWDQRVKYQIIITKGQMVNIATILGFGGGGGGQST